MNTPVARALSRAIAVAVAAVCGLAAPSGARAQPAWNAVPRELRGNAVTTRVFGAPSGVGSALVVAARREPGTGRIWLGTEDGPMVSAGGQWRMEQLPPNASIAQVRDILFASDGARYYAMRTGVYRLDRHGWRAIDAAHGVPGAIVYSLVETNAIDGTTRIVAGARAGVCVVADTVCAPLNLPAGIGQVALMVRSARRPNGHDDLWVAAANGGVARLRDGRWSVFNANHGLTSISAEDLAIGDSPDQVFVVGMGGTFELTRDANGVERFRMLPATPRSVYRVAWVPRARDAAELWIGTSDGTVLSWSASAWDTVRFEGERIRGQVTTLQAIVDEGDTRAVYVATRGGGLARVTFNVARSYSLPGRAARDQVVRIVSLNHADDSGTVAIATSGSGVEIVDAAGRRRHLSDVADTLTASVRNLYWGPMAPQRDHDPARAGDEGFVLLGPHGPAQLVDGRWQLMRGGERLAFATLQRLTMLDGSSALTAVGDFGMARWTGAQWEMVDSTRLTRLTGASSVRVGDRRALLLTTLGAVLTVTDSGVHVDSLAFHAPVRRSSSMNTFGSPVWLRQTCVLPTAHGDLVFATGDLGAVGWRRSLDHGAWEPLPPQLRRALNSTFTVSVRCDANGRLLLGGSNGLVVAELNAADPSAWVVRGVVSDEDGLPGKMVTSIGEPYQERVWIGTQFGPAILDLTRITVDAPVSLSVKVADSEEGDELPDDIDLPSTHDHLRVDVWLDTHHREEDSRYVMELVPAGRWWIPFADAPPADTVWTTLSTRYFSGLAAGQYVLRLRGRDFAGRDAPPIERRVTIRSPWWRSWLALTAYAMALTLLLVLAYRWRIGVLQRGTRQLIQSERRLRESEGRFRALFEGAMDANLLVESGRVVSANAAAGRLFDSQQPGDLLGRPLTSLVPPSAATSGAGADERMIRQLSAQHHDVPVQVTQTDVQLEGGTLQHIVLRDLTAARAAERERERIESHLRERQRLEALGTLAGGVAHDFNNLLGVIRGNAELADTAPADAMQLHEHLNSIVDASDRARDLVRQILAFSQSPLPRQERIDVSTLVRSLQPLLRRMIPTNIAVVADGVDEPHWIDGDPTQVQQVLLNLASNAEYAMRERGAGTLTISVSERVVPADATPPVGPVVQLAVRDTGVGMTREVRERVFEPFFTTKPTGEGTGLGMAVLHGVVVAHGGAVSIASVLGSGTTVSVLFPRSSTVSLARGENGGSDVDRRGIAVRTARLIVVDDEPAVARVLERALTRTGHAVRVFSEPEAALTAIRDAPEAVDLLLTDQTMPGMTGDVLAEQVRVLRPSLPVLILTGFSHRLTPERASSVGAIEVLQKPIALETLHRAVESALAGAVLAEVS